MTDEPNNYNDVGEDKGEDDDARVPCPGLTVGKLRAALALLPDAMEIVVYANSERDSEDGGDVEFVGGIIGVAVRDSHADDTDFLAMSCGDRPEDFEGA